MKQSRKIQQTSETLVSRRRAMLVALASGAGVLSFSFPAQAERPQNAPAYPLPELETAETLLRSLEMSPADALEQYEYLVFSVAYEALRTMNAQLSASWDQVKATLTKLDNLVTQLVKQIPEWPNLKHATPIQIVRDMATATQAHLRSLRDGERTGLSSAATGLTTLLVMTETMHSAALASRNAPLTLSGDAVDTLVDIVDIVQTTLRKQTQAHSELTAKVNDADKDLHSQSLTVLGKMVDAREAIAAYEYNYLNGLSMTEREPYLVLAKQAFIDLQKALNDLLAKLKTTPGAVVPEAYDVLRCGVLGAKQWFEHRQGISDEPTRSNVVRTTPTDQYAGACCSMDLTVQRKGDILSLKSVANIVANCKETPAPNALLKDPVTRNSLRKLVIWLIPILLLIPDPTDRFPVIRRRMFDYRICAYGNGRAVAESLAGLRLF
jgi:hypothetical protein